MLCAFAFIVLSGLMVFTKYTELRDAERHEQRILGHERLITDHVHRVKTSQREIKAHRSEIEAQQREAVQLLKKIMDTQAHFETEHRSDPDIEVQRAKLARQRKNAEAQLRKLDQLLAKCDQMLAECDQRLQGLADLRSRLKI